MPTLKNTSLGVCVALSSANSAYAYLRHTLGLSPADIAHLAIDKQRNGWELCDLPAPTGEQQPRTCVMLSGRVRRRPAVVRFWRDHPDRAQMDFVMHLWDRETMPPDELPCDVRDDVENNKQVRLTMQMPKDITQFVAVHRDLDADCDDVSRINVQLHGIACAFAMAVLNAAFKGVVYDTFIRSRLDMIPHGFRLGVRPLAPRPPNWFLLQLQPIADKFAKWDSHFKDYFYLGGPEAMRCICLAIEDWTRHLQRFLLDSSLNARLEQLVKAKMLVPVRFDPRQLMIPTHDTGEPHAWHSTGVGWIKWFFYTPESINRFIADEQGLTLSFLSSDQVRMELFRTNYDPSEPAATAVVAVTPENTRAFVINLDGQPQRLAETLAELKRIESVIGPVKRVPAVRATPGWQGCRQSHINVLRKALAECPDSVQQIAVFEDDFMWCAWCEDPVATMNNVRELNVKFDVILLNYTPRPGWKRIAMETKDMLRLFDTYSTAGYIVHRRFWQTLADFWEATSRPIDLAWQELQDSHDFFGLAPCPSNQRPSSTSSITEIASPGEMQILLIYPPNPSSISDLARSMFPSQIIAGHEARVAAARAAVDAGPFDCAVVVERAFDHERSSIDVLNTVFDRAASQKVVTNLPGGVTVFRRPGVEAKKFWSRATYK